MARPGFFEGGPGDDCHAYTRSALQHGLYGFGIGVVVGLSCETEIYLGRVVDADLKCDSTGLTRGIAPRLWCNRRGPVNCLPHRVATGLVVARIRSMGASKLEFTGDARSMASH